MQVGPILFEDNEPMVSVVAIDGPVGVGKSTVAARVAGELRFRHLDTGAMYRSVAWQLMRQLQGRPALPEQIARVADCIKIELLDDGRIFADGHDVTHEIRDESVSAYVAAVADNMAVRQALVREQRRLGSQRPSVLEGRDIGTVVFPDAACKVYLDASPRVRAARRVDQLRAAGRPVNEREVYHNLVSRDQRDRTREWGALRVASDAQVIDTTEYGETQVVDMICAMVRANAQFNEMIAAACP